MFYKIIWYICKFFCFITGGINYYGTKNIIKKPFLIISNHKSILDPILIALYFNNEITFLAKDSLFKNFFLKYILKKTNVKPVQKNKSIKESIKNIIFCIKKGKSIMIFPEGTRNKTSSLLLPFKQGAALIAIQSQIPVLPVAVLIDKNIFFSKKKVIFGTPIIPPKEDTREKRKNLTICFENKIIKLLNKLNN